MDKVVHCIHRQELSTACAFPTSMVCYESVIHSKRFDALGIRLRISHSYGCLSQDLCLDCCTGNLSISWRERWWLGVHEANSTKWESQQHDNNNLKKTNRKDDGSKNIWLFVSCKYLFITFYLFSYFTHVCFSLASSCKQVPLNLFVSSGCFCYRLYPR